MHSRLNISIIETLLRTQGFRNQERRVINRAHDMLKFVGIDDKANEISKNLPYGDQRRIEIARALASNPRLILLDEPTAGMNPQESADSMYLFRRIRDARGDGD
jgi:branched-chain amino acid transport system ATP-binding protein